MQFHANQQKEYRSYCAGWTFAKLVYSGNPNYSEQQLSDTVASLRIASWKFDPPSYRIGFDLGYRSCAIRNHTCGSWKHDPPSQLMAFDSTVDLSGNPVTTTRKLAAIEKEQNIMANLKQVQEDTATTGNFAKATYLADIGAQCCVTAISERDGNFGGREWVLDLLVDPTVAEVEDAEQAHLTVTFAKGKVTPNSRDRVLQASKNDLPLHNVGFTTIKLKNSPQPYVDFQSYDGICICGHDESGDLGDLEEHPF